MCADDTDSFFSYNCYVKELYFKSQKRAEECRQLTTNSFSMNIVSINQ